MRKNTKAAPTHSSDGPAPPMRLTPLAPAYQDTLGKAEVTEVTLGRPNRKTKRRLAAIFAADVEDYSRLMGADEAATLAALKAHRAELVEAKIAEHRGRLVKLSGDGILVEFPERGERGRVRRGNPAQDAAAPMSIRRIGVAMRARCMQSSLVVVWPPTQSADLSGPPRIKEERQRRVGKEAKIIG